MKNYPYNQTLAAGAVVGIISGAAVATALILASQFLRRRRRMTVRDISPGEEGEEPGMMEDLVAHNWHGF